MIRRLARLLLPLALAVLPAACVQVTIPGNAAAVIFLVPVMLDDGSGRMQTSGGYYDSRWASDPDSHPAVRPKAGATLPDTNGVLPAQPPAPQGAPAAGTR